MGTKISEMNPADALTGDELLEVVQGGSTRRTTAQDVADLVPGAVTPVAIQLAASDLTSSLVAGNNKAYCRAPFAFTLTAVRASLLVASSSGPITVDVNVNLSTILSTKLTIDQDELTSVTAAQPVITSGVINDDDRINIDIDAAGLAASGLIVTLIGTK